MFKKDNLRWMSLVALVLQNSSLVLLLRYSRTVKSEKYLSSTAIVTAEFIKALLCIVLVWIENGMLRHKNLLYERKTNHDISFK